MPEPLVSIIIPVYNSEKHIAEAINSALDQTWPNKEIIIVNDGSPDRSVQIAETFSDTRIRIYHQENRGASAARNKGLRESKGEYIQFLDADDLLSPNKITDQMAFINGCDDQLSISRTVYFFDNVGLLGDALTHQEQLEYYNDPAGFLLDMFYKTSFDKEQRGIVTVHSWLSPKSLLEKAGPWNEALSVDDDGEYFCRVLLESKSIVYVPDAVNYYRKFNTNSNLSAGKNIKAMQSAMLASELKYKHLKAKTDNPIINIAFAKVFMENAVTLYPEYKDLYKVADKWVKELGGIDYVPAIGGKNIELVKRIFGWKAAKLLLYRVSRFKQYFSTTNSY
ncbi:MAG: glycosyltransferase family 2 protein [Mucilaginibacter sp.]